MYNVGDSICLRYNRHINKKSKYHGDVWGTLIEWDGEVGVVELWGNSDRISVKLSKD